MSGNLELQNPDGDDEIIETLESEDDEILEALDASAELLEEIMLSTS